MTAHIPASLQPGFDACRVITRERARNFYYGLRLTPEPRRSALYAIYAWSRLGDDIADGDAPVPDRVSSLDAFEAETRRAIDGVPSDADPLWAALAHTLSAYPIEPAWLYQMIEGFRRDLAFTPIKDRAQLEDYCDLVAGTVGRMCVAVWGLRPGVDPEEAMAHATDRGLAFQLTNILRDFGADFDEGRVYIEADRFDRAGLDPAAVRAWTDHGACAAFIRGVVTEAEAAFGRSAPLVDLVDPPCRPVLSAMTRIYYGLLQRIGDQPRLVTDPAGVRLGKLSKITIAARAVLESRLRS